MRIVYSRDYEHVPKPVQFVAFGNLYPRTNQLLYRRRKCLTRVTTVGKDFLHRARIIPVTFQGRQAAFFHGGIRILHTLRINDQESGFFMAPPLATRGNQLIFLMLPQGG